MKSNPLKDVFLHGASHTIAAVNDVHLKINAFKSLMDKDEVKKTFLDRFNDVESAIKIVETLLSNIQGDIAKDQFIDPRMFADGLKESEWKELSKNWI